MLKKMKKGFTLIELMIVVAIIGILAAIAIPNFIRYQLKSKQAEAKTVLGGIKTSEESFRGDFDDYVAQAANPGAIPGVTKAAWVVVACPPTCGRAANLVNCTSLECAGYRPTGSVYFNYNVVTAALGVVPNWSGCGDSDLDGDGTPGSQSFCTDNQNTGACALAPVCAGAGVVPIVGEVTNIDPSNF